jgi:hypothetical protein
MDVEELFTGICDRIPDAMARLKVPGVALGIVCEGREFMKDSASPTFVTRSPWTKRRSFKSARRPRPSLPRL